jgi:hypothetical protein
MSNRKQSAIRRLKNLFFDEAPKPLHSRKRTTPLRLECLEPRLALSGLNLTFAIQNPHYNPSNVYVTFIGGTLSATYDGGKAVQLNHSYSLSTLNGGIHLNGYTDGRIFVSLGGGVAGKDPPEMVNPDIPSYHVRHDKIEITYTPSDPNSCTNLTAVDFYGIPLEIDTYLASQRVGTLTYRISNDALITQLAALTNSNKHVLLEEGTNYLRLLSPHTTPLTQVMYYSSMQPYINAVKAWQRTHSYTTITGLYSHIGSTPPTQTQVYSFNTTVLPDGRLQMVGGGAKVGWKHTIIVSAENLLKGIYLGNVPWTVDGVQDSFAKNDVYAAAVRDILSGFNLGFVASSTIDPKTGKAFGAEPSRFWWTSAKAFDYLQPGHPNFYNKYAQIVTSNSDAYSWAFSDRWSHVQAKLHDVDTMQIVVLPDTTTTSLPGLYNSSTNTFQLRNTNGNGTADTSFYSGVSGSGMTAFAGDWDGDGVDTVGLYNPTTGMFYLKNSNSSGGSTTSFRFGPTNSKMTPIAGDWDRDGIDEIGLYCNGNSMFYLRNTNSAGVADTKFQFGQPGANVKAIAGDWNGDRLDEVALYNVTTSQYYFRNTDVYGTPTDVTSSSLTAAGIAAVPKLITTDSGTPLMSPNSACLTQKYLASTNAVPITGDWDADGVDEVRVYNTSSASVFWLMNNDGSGDALSGYRFVSPGAGYQPISGAW